MVNNKAKVNEAAETPIKTSLSGHAGQRRDVERLRADAWHDFGAVTVPFDDPRLTGFEAMTLEAIGLRLFGPRRPPCLAPEKP